MYEDWRVVGWVVDEWMQSGSSHLSNWNWFVLRGGSKICHFNKCMRSDKLTVIRYENLAELCDLIHLWRRLVVPCTQRTLLRSFVSIKQMQCHCRERTRVCECVCRLDQKPDASSRFEFNWITQRRRQQQQHILIYPELKLWNIAQKQISRISAKTCAIKMKRDTRK